MRRVVGIETEFGLTCRAHGAKVMAPEEAARVLFHPISERYGATNAFLDNGGRCYLDVGAHPEYASAECDDLLELLAHDRAGELLLLRLAQQAEAALAAEGRPAEIVLFKNNTDSHGNAYGTHENYLVRRVDDFERLTAALLPFLVTRQLICGAGKVRTSEGFFEISQRAGHMHEAVSSATTRTRPLINTRDEPHADPRRFRRLHVIVGDANLAETSALLKLGSTLLVLRLPEERGDSDAVSLALADPGAAIRATSLDLHGRARVTLADGTATAALEVQRRFWEWCCDLDPLSAMERRVLELWGQALDALEARDLDALAPLAEWACKRQWLLRYAERRGLRDGADLWRDARIAQLDLAWHELGPRGVCRLLESRGAIARLTTPDQVERALTTPPATRALLRARLIAAAQERDRRYSVDWAQFTCTDIDDGALRLPDPLASEDPRVDRLIERMRSEPNATIPFHFAGPGPLV